MQILNFQKKVSKDIVILNITTIIRITDFLYNISSCFQMIEYSSDLETT